jgi:hypothetical protein
MAVQQIVDRRICGYKRQTIGQLKAFLAQRYVQDKSGA